MWRSHAAGCCKKETYHFSRDYLYLNYDKIALILLNLNSMKREEIITFTGKLQFQTTRGVQVS